MVDNLSPRKSSNNKSEYFLTTNEANEGLIGYTDPDRLLPIANVGRVMKRALPSHAKISKEAKETMQECVSEFISFVTSEASDKCRVDKRNTLNGDDVCSSLFTLGFDDYGSALQRYLARYREAVEGETRRGESTSNSRDEISRESFRFNLMDDKGKDLF